MRDLFSRTPTEQLDVAQFHFAMAQYWVFFALAYVGFAAVTGNRWGRWLNVVLVIVGGWFVVATPAEHKLYVGSIWIAWIALMGVTAVMFNKEKQIRQSIQGLTGRVFGKDPWRLRFFKIALIATAVTMILLPGQELNVSAWAVLVIGYTGFALAFDRTHMRSAYLMLMSLFFYWKVGAPFLWILLFSTVVDFYLGKAVYNAKTKRGKQWFIATSMITNLSMLAYFKYFKFFAVEWNKLVFDKGLPDWMHILHPEENAIGIWLNGQLDMNGFLEALPMVVGISFYTFQTMSYTIDIYRGHIKPLNNIVDLGFFVSFFPQLVAGPIVRASEFVPQIHKEYKLTKEDFGWGVYMILKGLVKKMVFADYLAAYFLDDVFAAPDEYSGVANLIAIFGYSLQIYGDFAGYTDMAIGIAKLMGFQLPRNFNAPYKAIHCGEFWKRWHITLSSWLKDYLYIPLGGNRGGTVGSYVVAGIIITMVLYAVGDWEVTVISLAVIATLAVFSWFFESFFLHINRNINITLTMLLGGLWHGASWQFVIWGGLNGTGVLATKYWLKFKEYQKIIAGVIIAGILYGVKEWTGNDIWMIAVYWALTVAAVATIFTILKPFVPKGGFADGRYIGVVWFRVMAVMIFLVAALADDAIAMAVIGTLWFLLELLWMWKLRPSGQTRFYYMKAVWGAIHTLFFITFTRVYFRGESMEQIDMFYHQLMSDFGSLDIFSYVGDELQFSSKWVYASDKETGFVHYSWTVFAVMGLGYLVHWLPSIYKKYVENAFVRSHIAFQFLPLF